MIVGVESLRFIDACEAVFVASKVRYRIAMSTSVSNTAGLVAWKPAARRMCRIEGRSRELYRAFGDMACVGVVVRK